MSNAPNSPEKPGINATDRQTNQTLREGGPPPPPKLSGMGLGFRLATDLGSALLVGGTIGWMLDKLLETKPWLFIVFMILGFAAGFRNIMRTFNEVSAQENGAVTGENTKDR
ncbi:AtpZ/AtpI family protein [Magnetococcus sp. PR-3]|uniref:AtpZ/AtpI family protein n=1 Tax=Magnetococcus sp. PR-3 TaxID=3120355 RepID=UPI002FCE3C26